MKTIVGITGGIASGKTAATDYLKKLGYKVICADEVYHDLLKQNKKMLIQIKCAFGNVFDKSGALDRKKLATIVFNDIAKLAELNLITHPFVTLEIKRFIRKNSKESLIFISAPLLFEAGIDKMCDKIICVTSLKKIQIRRIIERSGITEEEALKRINAQMPVKQKCGLSDFAIKNNSDLKNFHKQIDNILKKM